LGYILVINSNQQNDMENIDLVVLRALLDWRMSGKKALLATVVRTWGSSPRPIGSIMALCEDGSVVGSVSGGCIEDDFIRKYRDLKSLNASTPQLMKYGVTADEAHRFGLPCGGTLEVLLEFDGDPQQLKHMVSELSAGALIQRTTDLHTGKVHLQAVKDPQPCQIDEFTLNNTFGPEYRMLIIGAGQLSEYLAIMALFNGFSVTVCDPREEYRGSWNVPGVTLTSQSPDDVVTNMKLDRRSCVVALTHDPKLDDLALLDALQTQAFYIGAIGSRRNNESRRQRLIEYFDHTEESLANLRGPIGIYIGSKTPSEIAVSVMAEVLAVKNSVPLPREMQVSVAKDQFLGRSDDGDALACRV
jgi:xanthine dehydrogenase accessory factor